MGQLEQNIKKKIRFSNLQKIVLKTVVTAGVLSVALVAPNVIGAMAKLGIIPRRRQSEYVRSCASKMVEKGLLKYNGKFYESTSQGKRLLCQWQFADFRLQKPRRWDKKWRVVIFDIPEKKKSIRERIRHLFKQAGLRCLQDSVWVYPYDCEDILTLLKTDLGVGKNILYLIVDELENDKWLREEFDLT